LASDQTSLFLVYLRENEDKVTELPEIHQVPQMMAAGSHGCGSVMGLMGDRGIISCCCAPSSIFNTVMRRIAKRTRIGDVIIDPLKTGESFSLSPKELLERFDNAVLSNESFSEFLNSIAAESENSDIGALVGRLGRQVGISSEQAWAVVLDWLTEQLADAYTPSRQAGRALRAQLKDLDQTSIDALRKALASELPSVSHGEWHKAA
jgi:hypothetical protein